MGKLKAIIFDLDDTLFDCSGSLVKNARKRAAKSLVNSGIPCTEKELLEKQEFYAKKFGPRVNVFDKVCEEFGVKNEGAKERAFLAYNADIVENISPFPDVPKTLAELKKKFRLILVTSGVHARQRKKIRKLGLKKFFDLVLIHDVDLDKSKEDFFLEAMDHFSLKPEEIVSVGDRIHSEIKISNSLGMNTVQFLHGRFSSLKPKNALEQPDFKIKKVSELIPLLDEIESAKNPPKIVAIGGGTGLPNVLEGLKQRTSNLTAIVTVTDAGRSSGKLREDLNVLPPGDLRNCIVALSDSEKLLLDLFQYRFGEGNSLNGHSFGNLFIAALSKIKGNFLEAIKETSKILRIKGRVLPSTLEDVQICAKLEDGRTVEKDFNVYEPGKPPIQEVFLKPRKARPLKEALEAIKEADLIVFGPGSLFTSIIPNLLVEGVPEAIKKSSARKVYICNVMTQPGQTDSYTAAQHLNQVEKYLGKNVLDYSILNSKNPSKKLLKKYEEQGAFLVKDDLKDSFGKMKNDLKDSFGKTKIVRADILEDSSAPRVHWNKKDYLRHDPEKLANNLLALVK